MAETRQQSPRLAIDLLIIGVAVALELLASHFGVRADQGVPKGLGTVLGDVSIIYLGTLFLMSCFFPESSYGSSISCDLCARSAHEAQGAGAWRCCISQGRFSSVAGSCSSVWESSEA